MWQWRDSIKYQWDWSNGEAKRCSLCRSLTKCKRNKWQTLSEAIRTKSPADPFSQNLPHTLEKCSGTQIRLFYGYWWSEQWGKLLHQTSLRPIPALKVTHSVLSTFLYTTYSILVKAGDQRRNERVYWEVCLGRFPGTLWKFPVVVRPVILS